VSYRSTADLACAIPKPTNSAIGKKGRKKTRFHDCSPEKRGLAFIGNKGSPMHLGWREKGPIKVNGKGGKKREGGKGGEISGKTRLGRGTYAVTGITGKGGQRKFWAQKPSSRTSGQEKKKEEGKREGVITTSYSFRKVKNRCPSFADGNNRIIRLRRNRPLIGSSWGKERKGRVARPPKRGITGVRWQES